MLTAELLHHLRGVVSWVCADREEGDLVLHRGDVRLLLDLCDLLRMEGADVWALRVDEVEDDDLASVIAEAVHPSRSVSQGELGSRLVNRLEVAFSLEELLLNLLKRVRCGGRRGGQHADGRDLQGSGKAKACVS